MNRTFKYHSNVRYLTKDLKGRSNSNDFSLLDVYVNEKRPSIKIQLLNIFKDHLIETKLSPSVKYYDECPLSNTLWMKFYNSHGRYKPELNEYFKMYRCQLNFEMFCTKSVFDISWQHLNHPNLLLSSVYRFHVYFHVRIILHDTYISFSHEDGFSRVKNSYIKSACYNNCGDYGVNAAEA